MRIALVAPVAQSVPPRRSGSIETVTDLLARGLVARGHEVTLFAAGSSRTPATLHAVFRHGYHADESLWPWELCELFNLAAAVERAPAFDVIHAQAEYAPLGLGYTRLSPAPIVHTVHHWPTDPEVALWSRYPEAPFVAVSAAQAHRLAGLTVAGVVHHAVDPATLPYRPTPDDYLLFLGRFTPGKGVVEAIHAARRTGLRLLLAAAENGYYREVVAPLVDGDRIVYRGEVDPPARAALLGGARALLYPVQADEPFGLVLAEAMTCGTPVAALDRGAVGELVDDGVTGGVFDRLEDLVAGLSRITTFDRARVRARALERFHPDRMAEEYAAIYSRLAGTGRRGGSAAGPARRGRGAGAWDAAGGRRGGSAAGSAQQTKGDPPPGSCPDPRAGRSRSCAQRTKSDPPPSS